MKFLIMGAGALGSLLGAHLASRYDVVLVGRDPHMRAVQENGLLVTGSTNIRTQCRAMTTPPPHWVPDVIILAVKSFDTEEAVQQIQANVGPRTVVVSVQNGLGNLELIRTLLPRTTIIGASVVYGARLIEPGHVEAAGSPRIRIGGAPADLDVADALAEAWTLAGLVSESVPDIGPVLLAKALLNAVINPITALHRAPNGAVVDDPDVKEVARRLAAECQAVWGATRPDGPVLDVWNSVEEVARNTATNRSSMLQDVEAGRPTEERAILGAVLELAQQHRIATPGLRDVRARIVAIGAKATRAS